MNVLRRPPASAWTWAVAVIVGAAFGAAAQMAMQMASQRLDMVGPIAGVVIHLATDTWGWAVVALATTWWFTRAQEPASVKQWLWGWAVAWGFLTATSIAW